LQLLADLLGEDVTVPDADEATARGACVQAAAVAGGAEVVGLVDLAKRWQPGVRVSVPPRATGRDLSALRARWSDLASSAVIDAVERS
jgi:xylulokinase